MLKINIDLEPIILQDINKYLIYVKREICNWKDLWIRKMDFYEYHISQYKMKYKKLYQTVNYYLGMCECAISILNIINNKEFDLYINHERIKRNITSYEFYNPLNMILDVKVRDICEYFKEQFFYMKNPFDEVIEYLNNTKLTNEEATLFIVRMLYPSYYFDLYDDIISKNTKESKIDIIVSKNKEYEHFLKEIYSYLKNIYDIPNIEWLIKT